MTNESGDQNEALPDPSGTGGVRLRVARREHRILKENGFADGVAASADASANNKRTTSASQLPACGRTTNGRTAEPIAGFPKNEAAKTRKARKTFSKPGVIEYSDPWWAIYMFKERISAGVKDKWDAGEPKGQVSGRGGRAKMLRSRSLDIQTNFSVSNELLSFTTVQLRNCFTQVLQEKLFKEEIFLSAYLILSVPAMRWLT